MHRHSKLPPDQYDDGVWKCENPAYKVLNGQKNENPKQHKFKVNTY